MKIEPVQENLLRAILDPTDRWIDYFRDWEKKVVLDLLEPASFDLVSILYPKLSAQGIDSPLLSKIGGIYRYVWASNAKSYLHFTEVLNLCNSLRIPTLLIKGGALALTHYEMGGQRRMADFDLVVREENLEPLLRGLAEKGFHTQPHHPIERTFLSPLYRRLEHGLALIHKEKRHIDLHWHVLDECCSKEADDYFWNGAIELPLQGGSTKTLNPTDHLLLVSIHGLQSHNLRWVVDAQLILEKNGDQIDWERLYQKTKEWHLTLPMKEALSLIQEYGKKPLNEPIQRLSSHPVPYHFQAEHRQRLNPKNHFLNLVLKHWFKHARREQSTSLIRIISTFGNYFKERFGAPNYPALFKSLWNYGQRKRREAGK